MIQERTVKIGLERTIEIYNETQSERITTDSAEELNDHFTQIQFFFLQKVFK
jgi:hypothetical protein